MHQANETHDPALTSWVSSANKADTDFSIQNLPYAIFRRQSDDQGFRAGVAIGDQVLDLAAVHHKGLATGEAARALTACVEPQLNDLMAMGPRSWSALRLFLSQALRTGSAHAEQLQDCLVKQADVIYSLPCRIGDFTDFYTSIHHATNIGRLFRPDNPLMPNYQWVPIGYHGRASSVRVSPQSFHRPIGQTKKPDASAPELGPCQRLDYELEVGILIGAGNELGTNIELDHAGGHVFGLCLLNDWSARDIQAWEYQPLGPFLAKNFASTISPWVITMEALAPYQRPFTRDQNEPQPLAYLESEQNRSAGAFDIVLEVLLQTAKMREANESAVRLSTSNFLDAYWTVDQLVAHHTVNGCDLHPGDLFGSGTMSGPNAGSEGALIEMNQGGKKPITLPNGQTRVFLDDGDTVIMRAHCQASGSARIGFGEVAGTVLPART